MNDELPTFEYFVKTVCQECTVNEWYCPSYCETLKKAEKIPFEQIQKAYERYDGDILKVMAWIRWKSRKPELKPIVEDKKAVEFFWKQLRASGKPSKEALQKVKEAKKAMVIIDDK